MSEAKHTPGPWTHDPDDFDWGFVRAADGSLVANTCIGPCYTKEEAALCRANNSEPARVDANARLIAAAPQMFQALEDLYPLAIAWAATYGSEHGLNGMHPDHAKYIEAARAALAAAKGEKV